MTPERWQQIKSLLHSALERDPADRAAFLNEACAGNRSLLSEVEALITSAERAEGFIESPAVQVMAGTLVNDQAESMVGQILDHYLILEQLGAGGMGEVYLAEDTQLGRKVALKALPAHFTRDDELVRRFQQEARAVSALNHPNIVTIHQIGEVNSRHFIVTEFIEGETLGSRLRAGKMSIDEALDIAIQVASALCAAHQAGIVHRDIKPENVMLRADGIVKVLDFGLATLAQQQGDDLEAATLVKTKPGIIMGSVHYMSPEQARGQKMDARTDIFSLGVVLYQMASGRMPFAGQTMTDVLASIVMSEPPLLRESAPEAPEELQCIVHKALRKEKEERYETAAQMLTDLKVLKQEHSDPRFANLVGRLGLPQPAASEADTGTQAVLIHTTAEPAIRTREPSPETFASSAVGAATAPETSRVEFVVGAISRHKMLAAALASIVVMLIAALGYSYFAGSDRRIDSLAVLPFLNVNGDPNTEYLSDGIAESIIYSTSHLSELKVTPRSSVFRYKGREIDPHTVGRELGVSAIMTGKVIQRGDELSISAELVDLRDNRLLWGRQYNRKITDILALQEQISRDISETLRVRLTGEEEKRLTKRYTENTEAYRLYLKGRYYWNKRTADGYQRGIDHFQQAIEKDPNYALAWTGLADCYMLNGRFGIVPPKESMPKAKFAAVRALEIDDELAEAHTSLGYIKKEYDWDFQGAEAELKRAIQLNPNYPTAIFWHALFLSETLGKHDEALAKIERAQELEPLSLIMSTDRGMILYLAHRFDPAIENFHNTLDMDPNFFRARFWLGRAYEQKEMYKEAVEEFQKARQLDDKPFVLAALGHALAASGRRSDAQKALDELSQLSKRMYVDSYYVAAIHAALEDKDQAFQSLDKAYEDRSSWLSRIKVDPLFDNLHSDPRFKNLVQRIGLP